MVFQSYPILEKTGALPSKAGTKYLIRVYARVEWDQNFD